MMESPTAAFRFNLNSTLARSVSPSALGGDDIRVTVTSVSNDRGRHATSSCRQQAKDEGQQDKLRSPALEKLRLCC